VVPEDQSLFPQALNYGHIVVVPGFQFARSPVMLLVENVAIQHHPGYDVESYLFPIMHCHLSSKEVYSMMSEKSLPLINFF
jgi:hypothetical protein